MHCQAVLHNIHLCNNIIQVWMLPRSKLSRYLSMSLISPPVSCVSDRLQLLCIQWEGSKTAPGGDSSHPRLSEMDWVNHSSDMTLSSLAREESWTIHIDWMAGREVAALREMNSHPRRVVRAQSWCGCGLCRSA